MEKFMENLIITEINRIVLVGKYEYLEKKTDFTQRQVYYQELIYHFSGDAIVHFNEQTLHTPPNTIRYLPAGKCQKYIVDRKEYGECIDIVFSSDKLLCPEAFVIDVTNDKIATLFKKAFSLWVQKDKGFYMECLSLVYKILAEMQKTSYLTEAQFQKIQPAVEYIQNHFLSREPITAETLSKICGISYSYIKKIFNLKYKTSPKKYILSLKMNYVCDLLRHGEYTISQIAEACGYSDIYTFSHQFKVEFGISPTQFIKKYKSSK